MTKISKKNEPSKRNLDTFTRRVNYIDNTRSLKLLDFKDYDSEKNNTGYRYFLVVIDNFSKKGWGNPWKTCSNSVNWFSQYQIQNYS